MLLANNRHNEEAHPNFLIRDKVANVRLKVKIWLLLQIVGVVCLVIVVITHVAEAFQILPGMGWGSKAAQDTISISQAPF
jgi:hypothetical protein